MKRRTLLLSASWLLFGLSMLLPAVHIPSPGPGDVPGWGCVVLTFYQLSGVVEILRDGFNPEAMFIAVLALCNLMMLFSIPMILLRKAVRIVRFGSALATLLVCAAWTLPHLDEDLSNIQYLVGYYVWVLSFVLLTVTVNLKWVGQEDSTK